MLNKNVDLLVRDLHRGANLHILLKTKAKEGGFSNFLNAFFDTRQKKCRISIGEKYRNRSCIYLSVSMLYFIFETDVDLLLRDIHENDLKECVEKSDRLDRAVVVSVDEK